MSDPSFEERLRHLEQWAQQDNDQIPSELRKTSELSARLDALTQFALEIAEREGVSKEAFLARFAAAFRWYYDRLLQIAGGIDPNLGGHIDNRPLGDVPTEEHPPAIFPPK